MGQASKFVPDSASIVATGRLGKTPESKGKLSVASMAVGQRKKVNGEWTDDITIWLDLVAFGDEFGDPGELSKGDRVVVTGRLTMRIWQEKQHLGIVVEHIKKIGSPKAKQEAELPAEDEWEQPE